MRPATLGVHPPEPPELGTPEARRRSRLCAEADGFNLHAGVCVGAHERDRLERLCRYLARPPIPDERLEQLDEDTIAIRFKRPRRDGVTHILLAPGVDPTQCDCGGRYRLVATIRDPRAAAAILRWLAMRADAEPITPARPPPDPDLAHEDDQPAEAGQGEFDWAA